LEQIREGLASRLILIGIEGADAQSRATLSRQVAKRLRTESAFVSVNNGEPVNTERDRAFLFNNRYLLSPAVTPERFTVTGLHNALSDSIDLLASPVGLLAKSLLPRDPTGEMVRLMDHFDNDTHPPLVDGVWASRDGTRALILAQTRASGADTDAQQRAMGAIQKAFNTASAKTPAAKLVMTGPGVFSVTSRETIKTQVSRLTIVGIALISTLLLLVYRSFTALALGFLPVISGALAGVAAVSLGFHVVHGITLGFGTALIGEAVDYSIYLFVQSEHSEADQRNWTMRLWPTIRLGVLTSVSGFASLLLSGFPGLAQLGLYSISGLVAAAMVTRFVLPYLLPKHFRIHDVSAVGLRLSRLVERAAGLRWPAVLLLLAACLIIVEHSGNLWNNKIASLSPVSQGDVALDTRLRADIGAPDVRYLVVVSGPSRESEQVSKVLRAEVDRGELAGFEAPSYYLPSKATQRARQASLPSPEVLETRLRKAVQGLPIRLQLFRPFISDVADARSQPLLEAGDLANTSMAMAVNALLIHRTGHWSAILPLTASEDSGINAKRIRSALSAAGLPNVLFVDMKVESDRLYSGYLHEAIQLSLVGLAVIVGLLLLVFRSPMRTLRNVAPLAAAVITVVAGLTLFGQQLMILHLVGLLLVVAVGSNYALFFDRATYIAADPGRQEEGTLPGRRASHHMISPRTLASMLFANLTTVTGFGLLSFSSVSILQALGVTVAPGVILALIYSAIFARRDNA
jgi:predicted exporter